MTVCGFRISHIFTSSEEREKYVWRFQMSLESRSQWIQAVPSLKLHPQEVVHAAAQNTLIQMKLTKTNGSYLQLHNYVNPTSHPDHFVQFFKFVLCTVLQEHLE